MYYYLLGLTFWSADYLVDVQIDSHCKWSVFLFSKLRSPLRCSDSKTIDGNGFGSCFDYPFHVAGRLFH
jgi:hypothetical protein